MVIIKEKGATRRKFDFYKTPPEFVRAALKATLPYTYEEVMGNEPTLVLDPGCSDGVWGKEFEKLYPNSFLVGYDIREVNPHYDEFHLEDFLTARAVPEFDYVVGNPPFKYAEEFIRKGLDFLQFGGHLIFLLRLSFLESLKRGRGLFKEFPPYQVYVSERRIPFQLEEHGRGSDDTAYALFHWVKGYTGVTFLEWLDWSFDEEKKSS